MKYRSEIDGLRAVSVLAVVFYHLGYTWMPGGFVGVDVFFVISGYLITNILIERHLRTSRSCGRRLFS
jgi:peptidoglycan/LPS O-acetylase OafA/YrhL